MAKKNTDTVPAMLTPGEFVIKKKSAKKIGYGKLKQINKTGKVNTKKEAKMPQGKGTYGSQVGRPPKKAKGYKKGGQVKTVPAKKGGYKAKKKKGVRGFIERVLPGGKSGYEREIDPNWKPKMRKSYTVDWSKKPGEGQFIDNETGEEVRMKPKKKAKPKEMQLGGRVPPVRGPMSGSRGMRENVAYGGPAGNRGVLSGDDVEFDEDMKHGGEVKGYSGGGKVTSEGYAVHSSSDKYKVGE